MRLPATLCDVLQRYQRDPQAFEAVVVAEDERVLEAKLLRQIARAFRVDCHPLFIRMGIHAAANEGSHTLVAFVLGLGDVSKADAL